MGMTFSVSTPKIAGLFGKSTDKQIRFALALGLTRIGQRIKAAEAEEMRSVFDRPTNFTMNALQLAGADRKSGNPRAFVGFKDRAGSFIPSGGDAGAIIGGRAHYLRPQVYGGGRPLKAMESRLRRAGVMWPGQYALPGWGARLDAYGNMQNGEVVQVLAYLGGFGDKGGVKNTTLARKAELKGAGTEYFALKSRRGGLGPGIYRRVGKGSKARILQVFRFIDRPPMYRQIFDFYGVAERTATKVADEIMRDAMAHAMFGGRG